MAFRKQIDTLSFILISAGYRRRRLFGKTSRKPRSAAIFVCKHKAQHIKALAQNKALPCNKYGPNYAQKLIIQALKDSFYAGKGMFSHHDLRSSARKKATYCNAESRLRANNRPLTATANACIRCGVCLICIYFQTNPI